MSDRKKKTAGDYEVGYGRPPKDTRFKPGQSGNPRGRPKAKPDLMAQLEKAFSKTITVRENGKAKRMSRVEALHAALFARAMKGETKAGDQLIKLVDLARQGAAGAASGAALLESTAVASDFDEVDQEILAHYAAWAREHPDDASGEEQSHDPE